MKVYVVEHWEIKDMYFEYMSSYDIYSTEAEARQKHSIVDEDFWKALGSTGFASTLEVVEI